MTGVEIVGVGSVTEVTKRIIVIAREKTRSPLLSKSLESNLFLNLGRSWQGRQTNTGRVRCLLFSKFGEAS